MQTMTDTQPDIARELSQEAVVRPMAPGDSAEELTALLHRAYRKQVEMGLTPLAGRQTADVTQRRVSTGECFVAERGTGGKLVGMILLNEHEDAAFPATFLREEVGHFSLFAVDPEQQGGGIGARLLGIVEQRARELGHTELALSMAEPDRELYEYYIRRGFSFVEFWQWPYTNYRSVILSKPLPR